MEIYIDIEYHCHTTNPDGLFKKVMMSENAIAFFSGKCTTFIEGHRLVPSGETWVREDGKIFYGEMITSWKPYSELVAAQAQYEADLADAAAAYQEGVNSAYDT